MTVHTLPRAALDLVAGYEHWAVRESALLAILEAEALPTPVAAAGGRSPGLGALATAGPVVVLPVFGLLGPRPSILGEWLGWTTLTELQLAIRAAVAEPSVKAVLLEVDSPGGVVSGIPETADVIFRARGAGKPIIASVNTQAASAAYWLASQADEVVLSASSDVGSIGIFSVRVDTSEADAAAGLKFHVTRSVEFKAEGLPFVPATSQELDHRQQVAAGLHRRFVADVARGRGVSFDTVAARFGRGRMVMAGEAIRLGMADRIVPSHLELLRELLARFTPASPMDRTRRLGLLACDAGLPSPADTASRARARHIDLLAKQTGIIH